MKELNKLDIREIRRNTVIFNDGRMVAILQVTPPDFNSLKPTQKAKMIAWYRFWLEGLTYPVQICVRTVNEQLENSIAQFKEHLDLSVKQMKNPKDKLILLGRYTKWLEDYAKEHAFAGRFYFIVIPYAPFYKNIFQLRKMKQINQHLDKLDERAKHSLSIFEKAGMKIRRLQEPEIVNLYSSYFVFSFHTDSGNYATMWDCLERWMMEGKNET
jgi:hypothetical protein